MSHIVDLITQMCPDGVPRRELGAIGTITRGKRFVKADMRETGVPCIHYGEIYTKYGTSATEAFSYLDPAQANRLRHAEYGDVIIASAGETIEDIGKSVAWLGDERVVIHDACYAFRSDLDPKFSAYYFQTEDFRKQIRRNISSSKISAISTQNLARAVIPVPPLEVQREIVRVLDQFTQLEAELEAELEARRRQYEYYRDIFIASNEHTPLYPLKDIAHYSDSRIDASNIDHDTFVGVDNLIPNKGGKQTATYSPNTSRLTAYGVGDILIGNIRPYLKKIWLADNSGGCSGDVLALRIRANRRSDIMPEFLYYILSSDDFFSYNMQNAKGAKMPRGNKEAIGNYSIPIPPMKLQQEITQVLGNFLSFIRNLETETDARRKQYEYYRDRLLTFKEAAA